MSKISQAFGRLFEKNRKRLEYFVYGAIIEFTEAIAERMSQLKMSNSELAKKLRVKPSYVTKVLKGGTNFTLQSMVKIGLALDSELQIRLVPKKCAEEWEDVFQGISHGTTGLVPMRGKSFDCKNFDWYVSRETLIRVPEPTKDFPSDEAISTTA